MFSYYKVQNMHLHTRGRGRGGGMGGGAEGVVVGGATICLYIYMYKHPKVTARSLMHCGPQRLKISNYNSAARLPLLRTIFLNSPALTELRLQPCLLRCISCAGRASEKPDSWVLGRLGSETPTIKRSWVGR